MKSSFLHSPLVLVSVVASVVGYYIRKWLDEHDKGGN